MAKDYKSFSSAAKSRFRNMAKELGYEQITGIVYTKENDGWYEGFFLQASPYGNDFFYINYGVIVPNLWSPFNIELDLKNEGHLLGSRLCGDFNNGTKKEIETSAELALELYKKEALPWFKEIKDIQNIASIYYKSHDIYKEELGSLNYYSQIPAANYGLLLYLAGNNAEALQWLNEAERLMSLPVYFTRDGEIVHEREKYSRICKPDDDEVEQLEKIKTIITKIKNA